MSEPLIFLYPWLLTALSLIPILWFILRALPPRAKKVKFSAFFLLKDISTNIKTPAHTPWWILLLRALMLFFFIIAFAEPIAQPSENIPGNSKGNVLFIIDNGWAAASNWQLRKDKINSYIARLKRENRNVIIIPTSASRKSGKVNSYGPMTADNAKKWISELEPNPWFSSYNKVLKEIQKDLREKSINYTIFFSDGLKAPKELLDITQDLIIDNNVNNPYILKYNGDKRSRLNFSIELLNQLNAAKDTALIAYADNGSIVDSLEITIPSGVKNYNFSWNIVPQIKEKIFKFSLKQKNMASTIFLVNSLWRKHPVGIIASSEKKDNKDFLSDVYYLRRALEKNSKVTINNFKELSKNKISALILPDSTSLTEDDKKSLMDWVKAGGFLIRFAGSNLAANVETNLLPVKLRYGQRAMSGSMTWEKPLHLAEISKKSPLYGLKIPSNIIVRQQVISNPSLELFKKTWLKLEDGTPLITGSTIGNGTIILVHTTAGPNWSNFCYSGFYVEALERMISLSNGINNYEAHNLLPPLMLLDGFGNFYSLSENDNIVDSINSEEDFNPSVHMPPGIYGDRYESKIFNLGEALQKMKPLKNIPFSLNVETYKESGEFNLKVFFLKTAFILLFFELAATLRIRGIISLVILLFTLFNPNISQAKNKTATSLVTTINLAYIKTGDNNIDRTSYNGLKGLGEVISSRTSVKISDIVGINVNLNDLSFYPFIYWPMVSGQNNLSLSATLNVKNYLDHGGIILFDTRDMQFGNKGNASALGVRKLRSLTKNLSIPELIKIPKDNILRRSFYLLDNFPGRFAGGDLWVEKEPDPNYDSVTSIIIGSNDWASAWSRNIRDLSSYRIEPNGEIQREMAYRFGVNLLMMSLTGNYKSDQIHISKILERIGQ